MQLNQRTFATYQALILAILGFYLLDKLGGDQIQFFINPRFIILTILAALAFFILAQRALSYRPPAVNSPGIATVSRWRVIGLFLFLLPVVADLIGQALPYQARMLAVTGINLAVPLRPGEADLKRLADTRSTDRSILDWIWLCQTSQTGDQFNGQKVDAIGFVDRPIRQAPGTFLLVRQVITNTVADLQTVGMQVTWPAAGQLSPGEWVRVQGVIGSGETGPTPLPVIQAHSVQPVPNPYFPYLIP